MAAIVAVCAVGGLGMGCKPGPDATEDDAGIPVLAADGMRRPTLVFVPAAAYTQRFAAAMSEVHRSVLPALKSVTDSKAGWSLRTVLVGVGVNMEFGVGPIIKVGAFPRFRMLFTRDQEPTLP